MSLWISATATYLALLFFRKQPGLRFEITILAIWPIFTFLPASIPYLFSKPEDVYVPSDTGLCFFTSIQLTAYLIIFWDLILLIYILLSYIAVMVHLYMLSKQVEKTLIVQHAQEKDKMKRFWITLAISPIMYWVFYICVIVARLLQFAHINVNLQFVRFSIVLYILVGFFNSLWFGYSSEIYIKIYRKICGVQSDTEEGLLINKN